MGKNQSNQAGFGIIAVVLIVVVVAVLGGASYFVYKAHHKTNTPKTESSSSTASKSSAPPKKSSSTSTNGQPTTAYFTIKEWGVQAPYSGTDLTYTVATGNSNQIFLTSSRLPQCNATPDLGNTGSIGRYLPTDKLPGPAQETAQSTLAKTSPRVTPPRQPSLKSVITTTCTQRRKTIAVLPIQAS